MKTLSEKEALMKAAAYCSAAERCLSEVRNKLASWGMNEEQTTGILSYLQKEKYLDEARFCRSFIREKLLYNKWGRTKIAQALWSKRINADRYEPYLNEIDPKEYEDILLQILNAKRRTVKGRNEYETNGKLIRFALSRGFEMDLILKHVKQEDPY